MAKEFKFKNLVGNLSNYVYIQNALKADKLSKFIILDGRTGSGKTTTAKTIAMYLKCTNIEYKEEYGEPCYECEECKRVHSVLETKGKSLDISYYNMGREFGNIDEILKQIFDYESSDSIFIIDEPQVLTEADQSKMLVEIEDKDDSYIFLCTTAKHKLLDELRSRALELTFRYLTVKESKELIDKICTENNYKLSTQAKSVIVKKAKGCPRTIQKLTKDMSVINLSNEHLENILGVIHDSDFMLILRSSLMDVSYLVSVVEEIFSSVDFRELIESFFDFIIGCICRIEGNVMDTIGTNKEDLEFIKSIGYTKLKRIASAVDSMRGKKGRGHSDILYLALTIRDIILEVNTAKVINRRASIGHQESLDAIKTNKEIKSVINKPKNGMKKLDDEF